MSRSSPVTDSLVLLVYHGGTTSRLPVVKEGRMNFWRSMAVLVLLLILPQCSGQQSPREEQWKQKAEEGYLIAEVNLGHMYYEGREVPRDLEKALWWFRSAAKKGHASAQFQLGVMYSVGDGVEEDNEKGAQWLRLAAQQGHAEAQRMTAINYELGQGVPRSHLQAYYWYTRAASQSVPSISGWAVQGRDRLSEKMTREQIAEAEELVAVWKLGGDK